MQNDIIFLKGDCKKKVCCLYTYKKRGDEMDEINQNHLKNKKHEKKNIKQITHQSFLRLTREKYLVLSGYFLKRISHIVPISLCDLRKNNQVDDESSFSGLDCSGQGECQPNIEPSDGDEMQQYLENANREREIEKG